MPSPSLPGPFHPISGNEQCNTLWYNFFIRLYNRVGGGNAIIQMPSYTVATVPDAGAFVRGMIYVSDETGGAVPAFSDGTNWRRVTDRAIIS